MGPNARLFPIERLSAGSELPAVLVASWCNLSTLLRQSNFLLNNVDLNPVDSEEILVTSRSKDSFLIKILDMSVLRSFDSVDEVRFGKFSPCGKYVYTLTKTGTLNIFNKSTAKLVSKLNPNMMLGAVGTD